MIKRKYLVDTFSPLTSRILEIPYSGAVFLPAPASDCLLTLPTFLLTAFHSFSPGLSRDIPRFPPDRLTQLFRECFYWTRTGSDSNNTRTHFFIKPIGLMKLFHSHDRKDNTITMSFSLSQSCNCKSEKACIYCKRAHTRHLT